MIIVNKSFFSPGLNPETTINSLILLTHLTPSLTQTIISTQKKNLHYTNNKEPIVQSNKPSFPLTCHNNMISRIGLLKRPTVSTLNNYVKLQSTLALKRYTSTVPATSNQEQEILVAQRKNRPTSPHLQIYEPQLTWIMSSFHRITGVAMAGAFYALTCGFAATSILNIPFDTTTLVSAFTTLPTFAQYGIKAICAYPFVYHIGNGIRHLVWDFGKELTIPGVYRTGYAVLAATAVIGSYLAFLW